MLNIHRFEWKVLIACAVVGLAFAFANPSDLQAQQPNAPGQQSDREGLLDRIATLEKQLSAREEQSVALTASAEAAVPASSPQGSALNGRIVSVQGGVVANADVSLGPWTPAMPGMKMTPAPQRTARSTNDGAFSFTQVPPGQYVLQVDAPGFERWSQEVTVPSTQAFNVTLNRLEIPGAEATAPSGGTTDTQVLLERIKTLEERLGALEASTVLSEPETRVKRIEVFVDKNGNEYDKETPGATKKVTYQRERVYRRQTINEKIEGALSDQEKRSVKVGVSAAIVPQFAIRTKGEPAKADGNAYQLANADLFFTANIAQHTIFFADVVGISGTPPDLEVPSLTLLNGFSARLSRQNELNLREAWLRTEVFSQKLALTAGRLDLTNYFDHNAVANDETSQFLSDALVNNPMLGLAVNGSGFSAVFDSKNGFNFKIGFQQSNPQATSLSDSIYSLAEVGYFLNPFKLGQGNYRFWYRVNNSSNSTADGGAAANIAALHRTAFGTSFDQRLSSTVTLAGRFGAAAQADGASRRDLFYSGALQFRNHLVFNPADYWAFGYSQTDLRAGNREQLAEGYYNFQIAEKFKLSFHLAHVLERKVGSPSKQGYLVPGIRLQASF
ncbi:MAG TPA: carboxypeptidase regulatory-like domain-containing protein [Terriglobia bacterium]|nr:carboxypeptidase regulatory-like domain-containing protein [Terriglobia bacterium]